MQFDRASGDVRAFGTSAQNPVDANAVRVLNVRRQSKQAVVCITIK